MYLSAAKVRTYPTGQKADGGADFRGSHTLTKELLHLLQGSETVLLPDLT